jgi:hypothetical protein
MARFNRTLTIGSGPVRLSDGATAAVAGEVLPPQYVVNFSAQMVHGGSGLGYITLGAANGYTPNQANDGDLTAEIAPATSTAPGGFFYQNQQAYGSPLAGTVDLARAWIGGSNPGDKMVLSWDTTP